ncbi:MAG: AAA family ATPase [Planctomycetes bacterium]|nr:AAA family ATPase [Planctomycetota bacterium]
MRFTRLKLENWRNFRHVDVPLAQRVFVVGANASGKSNLLDVFRFLRTLASPSNGGLATALEARGGLSQVRCLHSRQRSDVVVEVELQTDDERAWTYRLAIGHEHGAPIVNGEVVKAGDEVLLNRPDADDKRDSARRRQTHLEQVGSNAKFRAIADALASIRYLHLVPQLLRHPEMVRGPDAAARSASDPYGARFLEHVMQSPDRTRNARLKKITTALQSVVPLLKDLRVQTDKSGVPHLEGLFEHWRPKAGWQNETHFSDGTLRLVALLWSLLEDNGPLLLEEPELSLHREVVARLAPLLWIQSGKKSRQVIVSTHSTDLLGDEGIDASEILLLLPAAEGTNVVSAATHPEIKGALANGISAADAVLSAVAPSPRQGTLFEIDRG